MSKCVAIGFHYVVLTTEVVKTIEKKLLCQFEVLSSFLQSQKGTQLRPLLQHSLLLFNGVDRHSVQW